MKLHQVAIATAVGLALVGYLQAGGEAQPTAGDVQLEAVAAPGVCSAAGDSEPAVMGEAPCTACPSAACSIECWPGGFYCDPVTRCCVCG